jgi:hypothetical protein
MLEPIIEIDCPTQIVTNFERPRSLIFRMGFRFFSFIFVSLSMLWICHQKEWIDENCFGVMWHSETLDFDWIHQDMIPDMQASPATNSQKSSYGEHGNISKLFNAICQTSTNCQDRENQ